MKRGRNKRIYSSPVRRRPPGLDPGFQSKPASSQRLQHPSSISHSIPRQQSQQPQPPSVPQQRKQASLDEKTGSNLGEKCCNWDVDEFMGVINDIKSSDAGYEQHAIWLKH